jgi:hypothetical protein
MDLNLTLMIGGIALAFGAFCGWRGARKPDFNKGPRLIPWRVMMLLSGTVLFLMVIHLAHLKDG